LNRLRLDHAVAPLLAVAVMLFYARSGNRCVVAVGKGFGTRYQFLIWS
jgi:hypothetical protein